MDIITVQNPFDFLVRDSDVEGMSDGYDASTAYGEIYGVRRVTGRGVSLHMSLPLALRQISYHSAGELRMHIKEQR